MSVSIKYKGTEIASASTETTKTIKTAGKYCEADILVENTPDSGDAPVINPLSVTENGTYTAPSGVDGYSPVTVNVPQGITPTGNINITDTNVTDVTNYATAQVVDADLVAENIKKDVNILGVVGSFEGGGGGSLPSSISKIDGGTFAVPSDTASTIQISHQLGVQPIGIMVWCNDDTITHSAVVSAASLTRDLQGRIGRVIVLGDGNIESINMTSYANESLTSTFWSIDHGARIYQGDKQYKWLAWA